MHKASTTEIDTHVRECATKLNDSALLAKLAMSDMHALDAQYHRKCLVALYNCMRQYSNQSNPNPSNDCTLSEQAVVLAELASYIEESALNDSMTSVFKLSDLAKLYAKRLNQLGFSTGKINSTRLKERLLTVLPELRSYPHGREILLAYEKDIGTLIHTACEKDHDSDAMVLAKVVK